MLAAPGGPGTFGHIIVLVQENRSFDHYFGVYPPPPGQTIDGLIPPPASACQGTPPVCASNIYWDRTDPIHEYLDQISEYNDGKMDQYVAVGGSATMGYYYGGALWNLARQFGLADHWFQPMFGPSTPQHLFLVAATAGGITSDPDPAFGPCTLGSAWLDGPNIGDRMTAAGVSWRWYSEGLATCTNQPHHQPFQYFSSTGSSPNLVDMSQFLGDLQGNRLPRVTYLKSTTSNEHPVADVSAQQQWLQQTVQQIQASSVWPDTAIVVIYDESGGWYDHVAPPQINLDPAERGLGPRVPALVISPYSKPGYVSHLQYDHTSILRFLEWNFGLAALNGRDLSANNLLDFFDFSRQPPAPPPPGTIGWRSSQGAIFPAGSHTSFTVGKPIGTAAGDVLVATLALGSSGNRSLPNFAPPAGWSLVRRLDHGTASSLLIFWLTAGAPEPLSYTWTSDAGVRGAAWISAYAGVNRSAPINADAGQDLAGPQTTFATPSILTTVGNAMLVASFGGYSSVDVTTWSVPAGMAGRANLGTWDDRSAAGADSLQGTAGFTGAKTSTGSAVQDYALTHLLALTPAGAVTPTPTPTPPPPPPPPPGTIVWRDTQSASLASGSGTSLSIAKPTGTLAGDALIAAIGLGNSGSASLPTLTPPAGWTLVRRIDHGTANSLAIYRLMAGASEPSSYTWTTNLMVGGVGWISAYGGVSATAPINVDAGQDVPAAGTSLATPSVTTTVGNTMLVASFIGYNAASVATTWSGPAGMTLRANLSNASSRAGASADALQPVAGASGAKTAIASTSQDYGLTHLLALKAAP